LNRIGICKICVIAHNRCKSKEKYIMSDTKKQKLWQSDNGDGLHPLVTEYIVGDEMDTDALLLPYDIVASKAHATMLGECNLITPRQATDLCEALDKILAEYKAGLWVLEKEDEDVHTAIELQLVKNCGDLGKTIHLGRSRNDQVLVAVRLLCKNRLTQTLHDLLETAQLLNSFAEKHTTVPMPGFTHMQYAMPSSVGQWAGAFVESLLCDHMTLSGIMKVIDCNPLGSAAGFGTHVPLDRESTTKALGFERVQINPIFCQNSRGKFEAEIVHGLLQVMMTLGRLANDMVIFCSQHYKFFSLATSLTTGSSIMPQKRNPDIFEVMRANVHVVQANVLLCQSVGMNLISGYNKDLKVTKKPVIESFNLVVSSLEIVRLAFSSLKVNEVVLEKCFEDTSLFAADAANDLVMKDGMTFRDAYRQVKNDLDQLSCADVSAVIKNRPHLGATGNLGLEKYQEYIEVQRK